MLESLIDTIQTYMIEKQSEWLQHNIIPFIRFFHMPSNHYNELVRTPFHVILPEELKENIRNYHLNPHTTELNIQVLPPRIFSNIIDFDEFNRIAGWIDYRENGYQ